MTSTDIKTHQELLFHPLLFLVSHIQLGHMSFRQFRANMSIHLCHSARVFLLTLCSVLPNYPWVQSEPVVCKQPPSLLQLVLVLLFIFFQVELQTVSVLSIFHVWDWCQPFALFSAVPWLDQCSCWLFFLKLVCFSFFKWVPKMLQLELLRNHCCTAESNLFVSDCLAASEWSSPVWMWHFVFTISLETHCYDDCVTLTSIMVLNDHDFSQFL